MSFGVLPGGPWAGDPEEVPNANDELALQETTVARALIDTDTRAIAERIFNRLAERAPGWIAHDANLETWLIEEFSTVAAEIRNEALSVPEAIYQTYGEEILGIPLRAPRPATGLTRWTAVDQRGYQIPVGTQITVPRTGDELVTFEVMVGSSIPSSQTVAEEVQIRSLEPGFAMNDLSGPAEPVDPLWWVASVEVVQPTIGGENGQTLAQYMLELIMLLRVVALRPILAWDFAVLALRIPGVGRAVAMDGYEPADGSWGHIRQCALIVADPQGEPLPLATTDAIRGSLEGLREVNWTVHVIEPEYEVIDVAYEVTAFADEDVDVVHAICDQAIHDALIPANFRLGTTSPAIIAGEVIPPPLEPDGSVRPDFVPGRQILRVNDLVGLLDRQRGVDWVEYSSVTINGRAADHQLPSPITLPRPGTIAGTVNTQ